MKDNFIHICFVIDRSGSMSGMESEIMGGFKKVVDEHKSKEGFDTAISLYTFDDEVEMVYRGKNVKDIDGLAYSTRGCTALYDAVCRAIDETGEWLASMDENERPGQNLVVIMTDGYENSSHKFRASDAKERIKHQEEKYSWKFLFMGADVRDAKDATVNLGIDTGCTMYFSKSHMDDSFDYVNNITNAYCCAISGDLGVEGARGALGDTLLNMADVATKNYEAEIGTKILNR